MSMFKHPHPETRSNSRLSPDPLLTGFAHTRILRWIGLSILAHLLLLMLTSIGYVRRVWRTDSEETGTAPVADQTAEDPDAKALSSLPSHETGGRPDSDSSLMEARQDTPMVRRLTETPNPKDIPSQPDDLGLTLEDTRR